MLFKAEKAIGDIDLATSIIENSSSPEEAIKAMQETEDALDSALHQVYSLPLTTFSRTIFFVFCKIY